MRKLWHYGLSTFALAVTSPAHASHIIELIDQPMEQIEITRNFVATGPTTLLIFGGYQVESFIQTTGISVTGSNRSTNLLHPMFAFTPAPFNSCAYQAVTSTVTMEFGDTSIGAYDLFSQPFSTIAGRTYTLSFLYRQDYPSKNGLKVTVDETLAQVQAESTAAVPEASVWSMMLAGFGLAGWVCRRTRYAAAHPARLAIA